MPDDTKVLIDQLRRALAGEYGGNLWDLCGEAAEAIEALVADAERYKAALKDARTFIKRDVENPREAFRALDAIDKALQETAQDDGFDLHADPDDHENEGR